MGGLGRVASAAAGAALLLLTLAAAPAFCQRKAPAQGAGIQTTWAALKDAKLTLQDSLRMADCNACPVKPCREYLIEALGHRWKSLTLSELKVTDIDHNQVILLDRDVDTFLYMFPLNPGVGSLLATVWGTGTTIGVVRVYRLHGDSVKLVFYGGSRFSPQFIQANESVTEPLVLTDRGYVMRGNAILPTKTEIWEWTPADDRFTLRATAPIRKKFTALARILGEKTN